MTEQTKEVPKEQEIKLTFSFPDVITVGHYQIYSAARLSYVDSLQGKPTTNNMSMYMGARALIMAGIVHINSDELLTASDGVTFADRLKLMIQSEDQTNTPLNVMQLIGGVIGTKVEAESVKPFLFGKSYKITTTQQK